ncbi:Ceramide glucosyltransferase [Yarrowia sp. B02]|nr:Ceramide glucosyltransferase [Yarrowia sp. B02]
MDVKSVVSATAIATTTAISTTTATDALPTASPLVHATSTAGTIAGWICLVWYALIIFLSTVGITLVYKRNTVADAPRSPSMANPPGVSILRPLKGIDPEMEMCLKAAFEQDYPLFEIIFAVEMPDDPAIPIVERLIARYPDVDARLLVGSAHYGPNPKVNNLVKAYQRAKYDIVWVLDANVWVTRSAMARSVDKFNENRNVELVHHLPVCVAIDDGVGAELDEMFMLTAHSKFYTAINWAALAPCVMGKSNMYRRSSLNKAVKNFNPSTFNPFTQWAAMTAAKVVQPTVPGNPDSLAISPPTAESQTISSSAVHSTTTHSRSTSPTQDTEENTGLQQFAKYIAEDNMIAEALWGEGGRTAMTSDSVVQPLAKVTLAGYVQRRVRWLRVRKFMVLAATLLEPTTESILCGIIGSVGYSLIFKNGYFSWTFFFVHMALWCLSDYFHFHNLLSFSNLDRPKPNQTIPYFAKRFYTNKYQLNTPSLLGRGKNVNGPFESRFALHWISVWLLRESLALPIWTMAMLGQQVFWRNKPFRINADLSAEEIHLN